VGAGWKLTRGVFSASQATGKALGGSVQQGMVRRQAQRGWRAAAASLVGPFDPPPPPQATGYLDYAGLATPADIDGQTWTFPIGRYVTPRKKWQAKDRDVLGISAEEANKHAVVYAPTQIGKTTSIIAPWIYNAMRAGYLVVAFDLKGNGDLRDKVQEYAATEEPILDAGFGSFDYTDPGSSVSWNWLTDLVDESAVEAAAAALVGRDRDNDPNREFRLRDLNWMRGLLELLSLSGTPWTVRNVLELLDDHPRFQHLVNRHSGSRAATRLGSLVLLPSDEYYIRVQFLSTYLEVLNIDGFNAVTRRNELAIEDLYGDPGLFVVTAPIVDGRLSTAVRSLFLGQFLQRQYRRFNRDDRPVLLVLDEAPRLKEQVDLAQLMSTSASSGMSVLLALQEVTDFDEKERDVILSNCATHILMRGAGAKTTEYFGQRLGTRIATRQTQTSSFGRQQGHGFQAAVQTVDVPVLGRAELASPPCGPYGAFVQSYGLSRKPILVDLARPDLAG
jgi:type IV secretory pathway TraG/TraD family ATPase VirD4